MKLLDLISISQIEKHGDLWLYRAGKKAGISSRHWVPNAWTITILYPHLTVDRLEVILEDAVAQGILMPSGLAHSILGEQFLDLHVTEDDFGDFFLINSSPSRTHG